MYGAGSHCRKMVSVAAVVAALNVGFSTHTIAQSGGAESLRFDLHIKDGRILEALKTIQAQRGDNVEIVWSADQDTRVHLHGYDVELAVVAAKPEAMKFVANATGRFPIHDSRHRLLIYLEVLPR